jgi:hypothetical protein
MQHGLAAALPPGLLCYGYNHSVNPAAARAIYRDLHSRVGKLLQAELPGDQERIKQF